MKSVLQVDMARFEGVCSAVCNYVDVPVVYNYVDATVDSVHSSVEKQRLRGLLAVKRKGVVYRVFRWILENILLLLVRSFLSEAI